MATVRRVTANGVQLHVELAGEGSSPPLVFLHGWLRSTVEWRRMFPYLSTVAPCVALDLPGFGQSDIPEDAAYDLPYFRDTIIAALDELKLGKVRFVGHGLGGSVAVAIALKDPARVDGIVAASPTIMPTPRAGLRAQLFVKSPLGKFYFERLFNRDRLRDLLLASHYHEPLRVTDEVMDPIATWLERPGARTAAWKTLVTDLDTGLSAEIQNLTTPTSLVWGYNDRVQPVDVGKRLEKEIKCISLKQIPNSGYQTIEDRPASVCRYLCAQFGLPMPAGVPDGHPTPEEGDYAG